MSSHTERSLDSSSSSATCVDADLLTKAREIAAQFHIPPGYLQKAVDAYISQAADGLNANLERGIPMIPSFMSHIPTGEEKGTFIAFDLGGTNFRVCSVDLHGDCTYSIVQSKYQVPTSIMVGDLKSFINYLVDHIEAFMNQHHDEFLKQFRSESGATPEPLKVGFTFSFPLTQTTANRGTLARWTKGYHIQEAVGKDLPQILQKEIDDRSLNLYIAAVVNDTVGTLMARSYTKPREYGPTIVGCIFGTGTNGAYAEPVVNIKKFDRTACPDYKSHRMIINTEWGSFDNDLSILPNTKYDVQVDKNTSNVGFHMFEKRVSGMFLGELLRLTMVDLHAQGLLFTSKEAKEALSNKLNELFVPWTMNTATPASFHGDETKDLSEACAELSSHIGFKPSVEELKAIQIIAKAIGTRSAYLSAVPIAGALLHSQSLEKHDTVDVGADGSVYERYPNFPQMIMEALAQTSIGEEGVKNITMGIAKDGSGVGAALCALKA